MNKDEAVRIVREARDAGERPNLIGADLRGANLWWADMRWTDLIGANLRWADLWEADLSGADLSRTNLRGADLRGADLRGTKLRGLLVVDGLPSGRAIIWPTPGQWSARVGCWTGTLDDLQALIDGTNWPEAKGDEQDRRRPGLQAFIELGRVHIAAHPGVVEELAEKWNESEDNK